MTTKVVFYQSIPSALIAGVLAFLSAEWGGFVWMSFVTWSGYVLLIGAPSFSAPIDAFITYCLSLLAGVAGGMVMAAAIPVLTDLSGAKMATPLVAAAAVIGFCQVGRIKRTSLVPAHFIGGSLFFGSGYDLSLKGYFMTSLGALAGAAAGLAALLLTKKFMALIDRTSTLPP